MGVIFEIRNFYMQLLEKMLDGLLKFERLNFQIRVGLLQIIIVLALLLLENTYIK